MRLWFSPLAPKKTHLHLVLGLVSIIHRVAGECSEREASWNEPRLHFIFCFKKNMPKRARVTPTRLCPDAIVCCISFLPLHQMIDACVGSTVSYLKRLSGRAGTHLRSFFSEGQKALSNLSSPGSFCSEQRRDTQRPMVAKRRVGRHPNAIIFSAKDQKPLSNLSNCLSWFILFEKLLDSQ